MRIAGITATRGTRGTRLVRAGWPLNEEVRFSSYPPLRHQQERLRLGGQADAGLIATPNPFLGEVWVNERG